LLKKKAVRGMAEGRWFNFREKQKTEKKTYVNRAGALEASYKGEARCRGLKSLFRGVLGETIIRDQAPKRRRGNVCQDHKTRKQRGPLKQRSQVVRREIEGGGPLFLKRKSLERWKNRAGKERKTEKPTTGSAGARFMGDDINVKKKRTDRPTGGRYMVKQKKPSWVKKTKPRGGKPAGGGQSHKESKNPGNADTT